MRIGTLAAATGTTPKTIRFYEQAGLLPNPPRAPSGYRDYPDDAAARLAFVRSAQAASLTLAEIRDILTIRDSGQPPCTHVATIIDRHLTDVECRLAELRATRTQLRKLARTAGSTDPATCDEASICRILANPQASPARHPDTR
jgi:MerR family copper efflux transcriptional regulator